MSEKRFAKRIQIQNRVKCTRRTSKINRNSNSDWHCKIKYPILTVYDIAQRAMQKRTPLSIETFCKKPSAEPPLKWEKN